MNGICESVCRQLMNEYPADTPMTIAVWCPETMDALAAGMDLVLLEAEKFRVLRIIENTWEGELYGPAMNVINDVVEERTLVSVPARQLSELISSAEQMLMQTGDPNVPVSQHYKRWLRDVENIKKHLSK